MALTNCPTCNHQISVKAEACPSCGHPIRERTTKVIHTNNGMGFWGVVGAIIVAIILISFC
jgi:ssDNA-binding Zn-finger/Zn-ribbon topoisomerase 1